MDLTLLELRDEVAELPSPPVAAVDRDAPVPVPVEGCWAVGYPLFQEVESASGVVRETAQVWGMILPGENLVGGLLSLQVTSAPRALPPQQEALGQSQWSGMSGAAVCAGERLDDVDPAHPLAALAPDRLYTLPDSPYAARLRELADQEITQLLRRTGDDLALDVLGLLTAARGPLAAADLATLTGSRPWKVREVLDGAAARTLQQVGPADTPRYTFAHETLLARCQQQGVGDPGHTRRIEEWAATWRDRGWPAAHDGEQEIRLYLLDRYPRTLYGDPPRLAAVAGDAGWVTAGIRALGVDAVLAELKTAGAAAPDEPRLAAMHAVVRGQAHHLRSREAADDPGFVPRQLCLQAAELGETLLAADCRTRQLASSDPGPVLQWTTRRASPALILELGRHERGVGAVAVLPDGQVVTGGSRDGRVLVWDPDEPGTGPVEFGRHEGGVGAVAVLPGGRVVSGGGSRRRRRGQRAGAGVGPGGAGDRAGRARPPRGRGEGGGGAAGRAGGHRRRRLAATTAGTRAGAGVGPGEAGDRARSSSAATSAG